MAWYNHATGGGFHGHRHIIGGSAGAGHEERADLVRRTAAEGRRSGRPAIAEMYEARAVAYREHADMIRRAMLKSLDPPARKREV